MVTNQIPNLKARVRFFHAPLMTTQVAKRASQRASKRRVAEARRLHIQQALGACCWVCAKTDVNLASHRKDGRSHKKFAQQGIAWVRAEVTSERYVRLCYPCHKGVHWAMDHLGMSWDDIACVISYER